jgi:hypothetical protein
MLILGQPPSCDQNRNWFRNRKFSIVGVDCTSSSINGTVKRKDLDKLRLTHLFTDMIGKPSFKFFLFIGMIF